MKTINVHEAKTHLSSLLARIESAREAFVICRNGQPVADLVPHKQNTRIKPHPELSDMTIAFDPVEPLSSDEWPKANR